MEIARELCTFQRAPVREFQDSISEFPGLSAGAGTWVCGNRKTTQMVTALRVGMQVDYENRVIGPSGDRVK